MKPLFCISIFILCIILIAQSVTANTFSWYCVDHQGNARFCNRVSFETPQRGCYFTWAVRSVHCVNENNQRVADSFCTSSLGTKPTTYEPGAVITDCVWRILSNENMLKHTTQIEDPKYPITITTSTDIFSEKCPSCTDLLTWDRASKSQHESIRIYQNDQLKCIDNQNNKHTDFQLCANVNNLFKPQQFVNCTATCVVDNPTILPPQSPKVAPKFDNPRWVLDKEVCTGCSLSSSVLSQTVINGLQFDPDYSITRAETSELLAAHKTKSLKLVATGLGHRTFRCEDKQGQTLPSYACRNLKLPDKKVFNCIPPYASCGDGGNCAVETLITDDWAKKLNYGQCICSPSLRSPALDEAHTNYKDGYFNTPNTTQLTEACNLSSSLTIDEIAMTHLVRNDPTAAPAEQTVSLNPSTTLTLPNAEKAIRGGTTTRYTMKYTYTLPQGIYNPDHIYSDKAGLFLKPQNKPNALAYPLVELTLTPNNPNEPKTTTSVFSNLLDYTYWPGVTTYTTQDWNALDFNDETVVNATQLFNFRLSFPTHNTADSSVSSASFATVWLAYDIINSDCNGETTESVNPLSGKCICKSGYSGVRCEVQSCQLCNPANTASCSLSTGVCNCKGGFWGTFCDSALCSHNPCADPNTGVISQNGFVSSCQNNCQCFSSFTGALCNECTTEKACFDGNGIAKVDPITGECNCIPNNGYYGNAAQCRKYTIQFTLNVVDGYDEEVLKNQLRYELVNFVNLSTDNIIDIQLAAIKGQTTKKHVIVTIAPICYRMSINPRYFKKTDIAQAMELTEDIEFNNQQQQEQPNENQSNFSILQQTTKNTFVTTYNMPHRVTQITEVFGPESVSEAYVFRPNVHTLEHRILLDKLYSNLRRPYINGEFAISSSPLLTVLPAGEFHEGMDFVDPLCKGGDGCFTISKQNDIRFRLAYAPKKPLSPTAVAFIVIACLIVVFAAIGIAIYKLWYQPNQEALEEARRKRREARTLRAANEGNGRSKNSNTRDFSNEHNDSTPHFGATSPSGMGPGSPNSGPASNLAMVDEDFTLDRK